MSQFGAPVTIVLPAASTSEVTATIPADTIAVIVDSTMPASAAFQYVSLARGFATGTGNQMAGGLNPGYRTSAGGQQGNAQWSNAAIGFASGSGVATARTITVTSFGAGSIGLTKDGATYADVTCTIIPIVGTGTPDLREGTGVNTAGASTPLSVTGLSDVGALLFLSSMNGSNGATAVPRLTFGMAASATNRWGVAIAQDWNDNPSNVVSRVRTDRIGPVYVNAANQFSYPAGQFDVGSMSATGYTITQNDSVSVTGKFAVLALPGSFALLTGDVPSATGTEATTGAGGTPSSGLFALSAFNTASNVEADSFSLSFGAGTVASQRYSRMQNPDNTSTPQPTVAAASGAVMQGANASGQTSLAVLDSFDSDGFTLDWTDADATAGLWAALVSLGASGPSPAALAHYRRTHLLMEP